MQVQEKERKRNVKGITLKCDVRTPPPSHVCMSMRVGAYFHRCTVWSVVGLCVLRVFWISVLVSVSSQVERRLFDFYMCRIMCVRYLVAIWKMDSISLWIFELENLRS